jgi:hypothetical protein
MKYLLLQYSWVVGGLTQFTIMHRVIFLIGIYLFTRKPK